MKRTAMHISRRLAMLLVALVACSALLSAQPEETDVNFTLRYPRMTNANKQQEEFEAVQAAKEEAIRSVFGTTVSSITQSSASIADGKTSESFHQISSTDSRGIWLKDLKAPALRYSADGAFIDVTVSGRVRRTKSAPAAFDCHFLRNGTNPDCETSEFYHLDRLFVRFQAPENGYLAIFSVEGSDVIQMLPQNGKTQKIEANKPYTFFADHHNRIIFMCTTPPVEFSPQYVVFSPNKFKLPTAADVEEEQPVIAKKDFEKWLANLRSHDDEAQCLIVGININEGKNSDSKGYFSR